MALITTTLDLSGLGAYDASKLRADYLRTGAGYPGGAYEGATDGTENMVVANPCVFGFGPDGVNERWVLLGFDAVVRDLPTANFNAIRFGQAWWLANGVAFRVARGTVIQTFARIQTNADWATLCGHKVQYRRWGGKVPSDHLFARCRFKGHHRFILDGTLGDVFQVLIDDDIQQLPYFTVYAWAYKI